MNRAEKEQEVAELHGFFSEAKNICVINFRGLTVADETDLRRQFRSARSTYRVIKNTLAVRAIEGTPHDQLKNYFAGPTAVVCNSSDPVQLAKTLTAFTAARPNVINLRAMMLDGKLIEANAIKTIAELPSKGELLARLYFALRQPLERMVQVLSAPLTKMAAGLQALKNK